MGTVDFQGRTLVIGGWHNSPRGSQPTKTAIGQNEHLQFLGPFFNEKASCYMDSLT